MLVKMILSAAAPFAVAAALAAPAAAQSFDCAAAETDDEKAICDSGRLSALDDEMAALYRDVEASALMGTRADVQEAQRAFLTERRNCGSNEGCITALYRERIADLKATKEAVGRGAN